MKAMRVVHTGAGSMNAMLTCCRQRYMPTAVGRGMLMPRTLLPAASDDKATNSHTL